MHAVSDFQNVAAEFVHQLDLLSAHFAVSEIAKLLGQFAEDVDDFAWGVATWTTGLARHTLPTKPDGVRAEQLLDGVLLAALHSVANTSRIIVVKLCSRTYCRAHTAVHTGFQGLLVAYVFFDEIDEIAHLFEFYFVKFH
mgnify:CR=1 FL=1